MRSTIERFIFSGICWEYSKSNFQLRVSHPRVQPCSSSAASESDIHVVESFIRTGTVQIGSCTLSGVRVDNKPWVSFWLKSRGEFQLWSFTGTMFIEKRRYDVRCKWNGTKLHSFYNTWIFAIKQFHCRRVSLFLLQCIIVNILIFFVSKSLFRLKKRTPRKILIRIICVEKEYINVVFPYFLMR